MRRKRAAQAELRWFVDELARHRDHVSIRGWAFHDRHDVALVAFRLPDGLIVPATRQQLPSHDVAAVHGERASSCRFELDALVAAHLPVDEIQMVVALDGAPVQTVHSLYAPAIDVDAYQDLERRVWRDLESRRRGAVLEIGARARSGERRQRLGKDVRYVGLDIVAGPSVDVVADAHELSNVFAPNEFDAVVAFSVFEHLLMPWKVALEINRVLAPGGIVLVGTHQSFPLHEVPWDFWRYTADAWHALFNHGTGFHIIETAMGEPARLVPQLTHAATRGVSDSSAFLTCGVLAEKIADTSLSWDVPLTSIVQTEYPRA